MVIVIPFTIIAYLLWIEKSVCFSGHCSRIAIKLFISLSYDVLAVKDYRSFNLSKKGGKINVEPGLCRDILNGHKLNVRRV